MSRPDLQRGWYSPKKVIDMVGLDISTNVRVQDVPYRI